MITEDEKNKLAEKIHSVLSSQRFADWYNNGQFDAYISGDYEQGSEPIPKGAIIDKIKQMFLTFYENS